jgi:Ubiquitin carboxyl-terminal hydrolase
MCFSSSRKTKHAIYQTPPQTLFIQIERESAGKKCLAPLAVPSSGHFDLFGTRYRLVGAAVHHGNSVRKGHWTALVLRAGGWFRASDSTVQSADLASALDDGHFQQNVAALLFEREGAAAVAEEKK